MEEVAVSPGDPCLDTGRHDDPFIYVENADKINERKYSRTAQELLVTGRESSEVGDFYGSSRIHVGEAVRRL